MNISDKQYNTTSPYSEWKITTNRFVAFLDIMGFKDMIAKNSHEDVYAKLKNIRELADNIKNNMAINHEVYVTIFSDSIIIFSKDDTNSVAIRFFNVLQAALAGSIYRNIPIKGGAAYGRVTVDIDKSIFFGQALVDAYTIEENLHYYGIAYHESADSFLNKPLFQDPKDNSVLFFETNTFFKEKEELYDKRCFNVNWIDHRCLHEKCALDKLQNIELLLGRFYNGVPKVAKYVDNTIEMYKRCEAVVTA